MIKLNDYLYSGKTVLGILHQYSADLRKSAIKDKNPIDLTHSNFLLQISALLEQNSFLTNQSQRLREFYQYMETIYPELAFTFKGRIKSLIRAETKFNGYIVQFISDFYQKNGCYPSPEELKNRLTCFRDLIAYRLVVSIPKCSLRPGDNREEIELKYLYDIAEALPEFLEMRGFTPEASEEADDALRSSRLSESVRGYYRDYVEHPSTAGYQSLHITLYDNLARCYIEVQMRTKDMDDFAEIGEANHFGYEKRQAAERSQREQIPVGECRFFDEACERVIALQELELSKVDVNFFGAINNHLINDGCGLYRGRLILPYEHLSLLQSNEG